MKEYFVYWYWYDEHENKEPVKICCNKCGDYDKMIRFLYWCKEYEIEFKIRKDSDELFVGDDFLKWFDGGIINDIEVLFGNDNCLPIINVYIE